MNIRSKTFAVAAAALGCGMLASGPVSAQSGSANSPPAPNAASSGATPNNSLPAGAATVPQGAPGTGVIGSTGPGVPPSAQSNATPAAPSGSTTANPSAAFQQTLPQPAVK